MFRSLQLQFSVGLISLVLIVIFQVSQSKDNQKNFINSQDIINRSVDTLSLVHNLERDVIELQRSVLIYKTTGSSSAIDRFENLMANVTNNLALYERQIKDSDTPQNYQDLIIRMRSHLDDYRNNFLGVVEANNLRQKLFSESIEQKLIGITKMLEIKANSTISAASKNNALKIHHHLINAQNSALQYFLLPDNKLIADFNKQIKIADSMLKQKNTDKYTSARNTLIGVKKSFVKLTNITRGHAYLINVVMAGSANEFLFLTKEISHLVKEQQSSTSAQVLNTALQTRDRNNIAAAVSIVLALLAAVFLSVRIILPIRNMTRVFVELSKGNNLNEIPALNRKDEIGALARAGNVFQNKNKETSELLEKTQKMNEQLATLTQEAQQASLAKGEFLASMSHEIRTPMNGVMGMLRLLERSPLNDKQQHYASIAKASAESLLVVINDILDFSKIEAGKIEIESIEFNLSNHLTECVEASALNADEKGLELILDVTKIVPPFVKGDPGRIRQIINNLLGNAIKFTDQGEVFVTAELVENDYGFLFRCAIKDTGIGISEKQIITLFDSFTQADNSTTRKYGGTGLGLAISKQLVELMGGELTVTSEIGKGSCFEFTLQLEHSQTVTVDRPAIELDNLNIIIVDDNKTNREVLRGQLELWGANVIEADSPKTALSLLESQHQSISLAIIDMQMPVMSGADLGRLIRSNRDFDHVGLVMMTSVSASSDARFFFDIGFDGFLIKPAKPNDLHDAITLTLNRDKHPRSPQTPATETAAESHNKTQTSAARILLVDDNRINLEVALGMLEDLGYLADTANNGVEAIAALSSSPKDAHYQLILMDCQMPVMDGYEASKQIRLGGDAIPNKDIPIIAITANAMQGDKEKCLEAGMNDYLAKPLDEALLLEKLNLWLDTPPDEGDSLQQDELSQTLQQQPLAVWDKTKALHRVGGKPERLRRLLKLFPLETQAYVEAIQQGANNNDISKLAGACHSLKGVAANLNADELFQLSESLELAAKSNQPSVIAQLLPQLLESYQQLTSELELELEEHSTDASQ